MLKNFVSNCAICPQNQKIRKVTARTWVVDLVGSSRLKSSLSSVLVKYRIGFFSSSTVWRVNDDLKTCRLVLRKKEASTINYQWGNLKAYILPKSVSINGTMPKDLRCPSTWHRRFTISHRRFTDDLPLLHFIAKRTFSPIDLFLDGSACNKSINDDVLLLSDSEDSINSLGVGGGIPRGIIDHHPICGG